MKRAWLCYDGDRVKIVFVEPDYRMSSYDRVVPIVYAILEED